MAEVHSASVGSRPQASGEPRPGEIAVHGRGHESESAVATPHLPAQAPGEKVGPGFDHRLGDPLACVNVEGRLPGGDGLEEPERPAVADPAGHLRRTEDGGPGRRVRKNGLGRHGAGGWLPDPAGIEELGRGDGATATGSSLAEAEHVGAFDEERPPLLIPGFVGG